MPASVHLTPEQMNELFPPTPPAPAPSREQLLEHALDAMLLSLMERVLDRAELDELAANNRVAAERLLGLLLQDLTWRKERLAPKVAS